MTRQGRRSLHIIGSQIVAQLAMVAVIPLMTRVYPAPEVGWYQLATAVAMTVQPVATLRMEYVVPSTRYEANVLRLLRASKIAALALSGSLVTAGAIAALAGADVSSSTLLMAGVLLAGLAWTAIDNARLIRLQQEKALANRNLAAGVLAAVLQIIVICAEANIVLLAVAVLAGRAIAITFTRGKRTLNVDDLGEEPAPYTAARATRSVLSGLVANSTSQALVFGASVGVGAGASAYVGLAQRAAGTPLALLGQGLAQVMQSRVAPVVRGQQPGLLRHIQAQLRWLGVLSAGTAAGLIALAPPLAVPLLGPGWQVVGTITAILAVPLSLQLLVGPLMAILPLLALEGLLLAIQVSRLCLAVAFVLPGVLGGADVIELAILYGIAATIGYLGMLGAVLLVARRYDQAAETTG